MVYIVIIPPPGWPGDRILVGAKDVLFQNVQIGSVAFYLRSPDVLSWGFRGQGLKFTTDVHLVLRLGWSYTLTSPVCLHNVGIVIGYGLEGVGIESCCGL
jgi:hypothetical protein